jgi:hypothetical protein
VEKQLRVVLTGVVESTTALLRGSGEAACFGHRRQTSLFGGERGRCPRVVLSKKMGGGERAVMGGALFKGGTTGRQRGGWQVAAGAM